MHFTREPIIETIVTPKDGYKLLIRSSKIAGAEEYIVDALEIVSFGFVFFYRSVEKPKSFLLSVTDYEVAETRETKIALKTTYLDRGIKIGGGKEISKKEPIEESLPESASEDAFLEKKKDRKRNRRRRGRSDDKEETSIAVTPSSGPYDTFMEVSPSHDHDKLVGDVSEAVILGAHQMHILLPPPLGLISESFGKNKPKEETHLPEAPVTSEERVKILMDDVTED